MTSPSKTKGNLAERQVAAYLEGRGWAYAERSRSGWTDDRGDIDGLPGWVVEVKNQRRHDLAGWMDETRTEAANASVGHGLLVVKRAGVGDVARWYAIMEVHDWCDLAIEGGWQ